MCFFPTLIKNKKYTPNKKNGGIIPPVLDKRTLAVPIGCGNCLECRKAKAKEWQVRLLEDVRHHKNGKFITLTFSNESIKKLAKEVTQKTTKVKIIDKYEVDETGTLQPIYKCKTFVDKNGNLRKRYKYKTVTEEIILKGYETDNAIAKLGVRKFLERWRKQHGKSMRHWFITELGHNGTENIHLHGIVWTDENVREIAKKWDYGFIWIGEKDGNKIKNYVTEKTVNYITKYVHKIDLDHREYKSIVLTSAGIGAGYMERLDCQRNKYNGEKTREYYTTRTGHKMSLPIYWRNKIYSDEERELLWLQKLDKEERWVGGEQISIKHGYEEYYKTLEHYRRKNERLGYGTSTIDWCRKKYEEQLRNLLTQQRITATEKIEYEPEWVSNESILRWRTNDDWLYN